MTSRLPSDVLFAIFFRLPIKSLCRFRFVSRSFLHMLNDTRFVNMHLTQPQRIKLMLSSHFSLYPVDTEKLYSADKKIAAVKLEFAPSEGMFSIQESCNGLLLIEEEENKRFLVCNPSTRVSKRIPEFPLANARQIYGFGYAKSSDDYKFEIYGFGYAKSSDDYKFVKGSFSPTSELCVFNLRTNSWRSVENDLPPIASLIQSRGAYFNGAIHWAFKQGIGVFDLDEEQCKVMPHPAAVEEIEDIIHEPYSVGVVGNCLCVLYNLNNQNQGRKYKFFIMKDYGVKESWYGISIDLPKRCMLCRPLSLWEKDLGILFLCKNSWFGYFSILSYQADKTFFEIKIGDESKQKQIVDVNVYVENMVSPKYHKCEFCCMEDID